jgi:hypothetical protein
VAFGVVQYVKYFLWFCCRLSFNELHMFLHWTDIEITYLRWSFWFSSLSTWIRSAFNCKMIWFQSKIHSYCLKNQCCGHLILHCNFKELRHDMITIKSTSILSSVLKKYEIIFELYILSQKSVLKKYPIIFEFCSSCAVCPCYAKKTSFHLSEKLFPEIYINEPVQRKSWIELLPASIISSNKLDAKDHKSHRDVI